MPADLVTSVGQALAILTRSGSGEPELQGWVVPRDRCMARDRPSPYVKGAAFFYRSAGACPPRSLHGRPSPYGKNRTND